MKILWLASWYPSQIDPYNGDFIQRHAEAVSLYHDVTVIHVIKDSLGLVTKGVTAEVRQRGRLTEHIIYYHSRFAGVPLLGRLLSDKAYRRVFKQHLIAYVKRQGKPDCVHVHVCMKAGMLALWLKRKFGWSYVVTEHSSQYYPGDEHSVYRRWRYYRNTCLRILQRAAAVSVVSNQLGRAVHDFSGRVCGVIPNVVNTDVFYPVPKSAGNRCRFLHISGLQPLKQPEKILEAAYLLKKRHTGFQLDIVGPENKILRQRVISLGLTDIVFFHPERPQPQLAPLVQKADGLILFSRYETFGCVLIEANACGVPVIVNDLTVMREMVTNGLNGLIVPDSADALADAMEKVLEGQCSFDAAGIALAAKERFGYPVVGEAFTRLYKSLPTKTGL